METDFARITAEILSAYQYTETELAKELGVDQSTINRLKRGEIASPGFSTGSKLVEIHKKRPRRTAA